MRVQLADFTDALEKVILGAERKITISQAERERTAYHESGHAIVGMLQPGADPVRKVSIVPRGRALGGRAAEEIMYGEITTGAESDLEAGHANRPTDGWALGHVGRCWAGLGAARPAGRARASSRGVAQASDRTQELIDDEVKRIADECYAAALAILRANRDKLESLAQALLEHETLDEEEAYRAANIDRGRDDTPAPEAAPQPA